MTKTRIIATPVAVSGISNPIPESSFLVSERNLSSLKIYHFFCLILFLFFCMNKKQNFQRHMHTESLFTAKLCKIYL